MRLGSQRSVSYPRTWREQLERRIVLCSVFAKLHVSGQQRYSTLLRALGSRSVDFLKPVHDDGGTTTAVAALDCLLLYVYVVPMIGDRTCRGVAARAERGCTAVRGAQDTNPLFYNPHDGQYKQVCMVLLNLVQQCVCTR